MTNHTLLELRRRMEPAWRAFRIVKAKLFPRRYYALEGLRFAVTNVCNARCVFCSYPQAKMKAGFMSQCTFEKAVRLAGRRMTVLDLSPAIGEPLLDPGITRKITWAKTQGYQVFFSTNGITFHRDHQWLVDHGDCIDSIQISIPSFNAGEYSEQFGVDRGQQTLDGLLDLLRENERAGQRLKLIIQIRNREHLQTEKASEGWRRFQPFIHGRVSCNFTPQWENWSGDVDFSKWSPYMLARVKASPQIDRPCRNLRGGLVNPDGTVRLCGCRVIGTDHDDLLIGNVETHDWDDLERAAIAIRNRFYQRDYPRVCRGCSFYNPE